MNGDMSKTHLLGLIERDRAHWETLLGSIPEVWMTEPGVEGEWSIKDIIAHIAWGERENLGVVHARAVVGSELWQLSEDERMPSCSNRIAAASSATCSRIPVAPSVCTWRPSRPSRRRT